MRIRAYRAGDGAALVELWRRSAAADAPSYEWFCDAVLLDANFDPAGLLVAVGGERPVGCAYAVRRRTPLAGTEMDIDTGWVPFFFVDPAARCQGIGSALLSAACDFLRGLGRRTVDFGCYTPHYFVPGIDSDRYPDGGRLLARMGFEVRSSAVAMDLSLVDFAIPDDVRRERARCDDDGFVFGIPTREDIRDVIDFAGTAFAPDWGEAIRDFVLAGRPLHQIRVARRDGHVAAFCMYGGYRGIRERFGPFGVDPPLRGAGLGKVLLYDCLAAMSGDGLHGAWFLWTGEESPAGRLYHRAGFRITRRFDVVRAVVDPRDVVLEPR